MSAGPIAPSPRATVYYDGGCPLCAREIATYRRLRGAEACAWVDVTRCDIADLGPDLTRGEALARLHVRGPDGRLHRGARGFAAMWRALPSTAWLGRLASVGPVPWLLEAAYTGFLALRLLWRRPVCDVAPNAGARPGLDTAGGAATEGPAAATHRLAGDEVQAATDCPERSLTVERPAVVARSGSASAPFTHPV